MLNKGLSVFAAVTLSSSMLVAAESYLIKVEEGHLSSKALDHNLQKMGEVQTLRLSFGTYKILKTSNKLNLKALKNSLPGVESIEPNHTWRVTPTIEEPTTGDTVIDKIPNLLAKAIKDRRADEQWALFNDGGNSGGLLGLGGKAREDMNILDAWKVTKGSKKIKIAVIDTGIDYKHPDLKSNMWVNQVEFKGEADVDDDGNGFVDDIYGYNFDKNIGDPMDDNGHGSHCAGVIGAAHNTIGIAGMMSEVQLVALKFLNRGGSGETSAAIQAIDYAIKLGVDVMSNSWGGDEHSVAMEDAIKAANQAGIVFVVASGNESANNDISATYPTNYNVDNLISVCAFKGDGELATFSNMGVTKVHVCAPGNKILSTFKSGGYKTLSGTSMACPYVAGAVGLLLSNEKLLPKQVKERIIRTSTQTEDLMDLTVSSGRVDTARLLNNR